MLENVLSSGCVVAIRQLLFVGKLIDNDHFLVALMGIGRHWCCRNLLCATLTLETLKSLSCFRIRSDNSRACKNNYGQALKV